jgi:hypothetical protein
MSTAASRPVHHPLFQQRNNINKASLAFQKKLKE